MSKKTNDVSSTQQQDIEKIDKEAGLLTHKITNLNALACNDFDGANFDQTKATQEAKKMLNALGAEGGLQEMLAAQVLSIHQLQQVSMAMARNAKNVDNLQYFTNAGVKLSNAFVQQVNLLNKLQGNGGQKVVVEHVDVHSGGQAIVGNINGGLVKK